jgi:hypothetical protein
MVALVNTQMRQSMQLLLMSGAGDPVRTRTIKNAVDRAGNRGVRSAGSALTYRSRPFLIKIRCLYGVRLSATVRATTTRREFARNDKPKPSNRGHAKDLVVDRENKGYFDQEYEHPTSLTANPNAQHYRFARSATALVK